LIYLANTNSLQKK